MKNKRYVTDLLANAIRNVEFDNDMEAWELDRYFEEVFEQIEINF